MSQYLRLLRVSLRTGMSLVPFNLNRVPEILGEIVGQRSKYIIRSEDDSGKPMDVTEVIKDMYTSLLSEQGI